MLALLAGLSVGFLAQTRELRSQAELTSLTVTLAALRTAMVTQSIQQHISGHVAAATPGNPFLLLQKPPANYRGEQAIRRIPVSLVGQWWFDPVCSCVAYVPIATGSLRGDGGAGMLVFRLETGAGPVPLQPSRIYFWHDALVN